MLGYFTLPIAVLLGFLDGLGVGGGSLLMLWLTLVVGMDYPAARTINLLFFLPSAVIATLFRRSQRTLSFKVLPAMITGCISAALFAYVGKHFDTDLLKKIFGGILLFTGARELLYRPRNAK